MAEVTLTRRTSRSVLALLAAASLLLTPALAGRATAKPTSKELGALELVNRAREKEGLSPLTMNEKLRRKAHRHSVKMASQGRIFHSSCLSCLSPKPNWNVLGENVARGGGLKSVHRAFMRSSAHRSNIVCGCYHSVGIGVVRKGGRLYVTQIFLG